MTPRDVSFAFLFAALGLAGCVTQNVAQDMGEQSLGVLVGRPVSEAVTKYGPPSEERSVLGERVIVWRNGTSSGGGASENRTYDCTILLTIDNQDIVKAWRFEGRGCIGNEIDWSKECWPRRCPTRPSEPQPLAKSE
jgi:hypothetical protein